MIPLIQANQPLFILGIFLFSLIIFLWMLQYWIIQHGKQLFDQFVQYGERLNSMWKKAIYSFE